MRPSKSAAAADLVGLLSAIDLEIRAAAQQQGQMPASGPAETLEELGRHICFLLGGRHLAVPLSLVLEVGELETVRPLPFLPDWAEGVTNIRGEIVSVTDLAAFFHLAAAGRKKSRTFLIIHDGELKTAAVVDRITGTRLLYRRKDMTAPSAGDASTAGLSGFVGGPALFFAERAEQMLELFDGIKLLSSIKLQ